MGFFKTKISIVILFVVIFTNQIHAQVTVGSNIPPETHSLLQVKEIQPTFGDEAASTVNTGGFLLPRVSLTMLNSLSDLSVYNPEEELTKREHVGLVVFNVNTIDDITPGLYVWDGKEWMLLLIQ